MTHETESCGIGATVFEDSIRITAPPVDREIAVEEVVEAFGGNGRSETVPYHGSVGFDARIETIRAGERTSIQTEACPVCSCTSGWPTFSVSGTKFSVATCLDCGVGQLHPRPTPKEIASFYPPDYYGHSGAKFEPIVETLVRWVGARHARSLTRQLPNGARILDVGCGRGVLLGSLADRGFEVHGFEISQTAAQGADPRAQIRLANSLAEAKFPKHHFDQVILWHVLEHMPQPREALEEIHRILKPGGQLAVAVPNFGSVQARWAGSRWFHLDLPRHLFHFPHSALVDLLNDCGFECRTHHHFSLRQNPFGWVQSALNGFRSLPPNCLYALLKQSGSPSSRQFDAATRFRLRIAYALGMPLAVVASMGCAIFRSGASICVEAVADEKLSPTSAKSHSLDEFATLHPECFGIPF